MRSAFFLKQADINFYNYFFDYISCFETKLKEDYFKSENLYFFFKVLDFLVNYIYSSDEIYDQIFYFDSLCINSLINLKGILHFLKKNTFLNNLINKTDFYGFLPVHDCAKYGNYNTFIYLLHKTDEIII